MNNNIFAKRLKKMRKEVGLSQPKLGELISMSRFSIIDYESGKTSPDIDTLVKIANVLNISAAYLMGETDNPTSGDQATKKEQPAMKSNVHFEIEEPISIDQIIIPVLSPEQTACCGNGIPLSENTYCNDEKILVPRKEVGRLCDGKMPFAINADGNSMEKWGIKDGSKVVINPVEEVHDFDIALVCYKDSLALKKLQRMQDGSINLISSDGNIITVPAEDTCLPDLFAIWGKAMTYTYKESGKIKHGL